MIILHYLFQTSTNINNMSYNAKLFSGTGSQYLSEAIAKQFGEPLGKVNIQRFSDG
jgi:ribose-phosphate pyrophosphokinase